MLLSHDGAEKSSTNWFGVSPSRNNPHQQVAPVRSREPTNAANGVGRTPPVLRSDRIRVPHHHRALIRLGS